MSHSPTSHTPPPAPMPAHTPPPAASVTKDFKAAWDCLSDPKKSTDPAKLQEVMNEIGLYSEDELEYLEMEQFNALAVLLKPIPQKKFKSCVGI